MDIADQGFKKWAKITCPARQVLAIVLIWQASHSLVLGQFGSTVQQFPQVVLNGGSTTSFTIHNPSPEKTIDVDVQLYSPAGGALADAQVELGPEETETVSFGDAGAPLTRGWAELKSDAEFIATELFQLFLGGLKPRVGVLPSPAAEEIKFLGFVNEQFKSGLAVHNPSLTEATEITLRLKDNAGQEPVTERTLTLAPLQSEAAFLNEVLLFGPSLSSFEGVVEISVNSAPVAVLSLIQEPNGDVATVSVESSSHYWSETTSGSPNVIAGDRSNRVTPGVQGATIGGGGGLAIFDDGGPSKVTDDFSTVGGGTGNQAGDDAGDTGDGAYSTVGGGLGNTASGNGSTVGGGRSNTASGGHSTAGGGGSNTASGSGSTVGGGLRNTASGMSSTVAGGVDNLAGGAYSFAAGQRARASVDGSFFWADSNPVDFPPPSTFFLLGTKDLFWARATGGVQFVSGINASGQATSGVSLSSGGSSWSSTSDRKLKEHFQDVDPRQLLEGLSKVPITTWNYKAQGNDIRHIGPMSQDFHATFQVGEDERHISTVDADGVALAAIQGLYEMVQERDAEMAQQQEEIETLRIELRQLRAMLSAN